MNTVEDRKSRIERIFSAVGIKPVHRQKIEGEDVYFADGFVSPAMINKGGLAKFQVSPGEFPFGVFLTLWWTDQHKGVGSIAFFDAFHDPGHSKEQKAQMRINTAVTIAQRDIKKRKNG